MCCLRGIDRPVFRQRAQSSVASGQGEAAGQNEKLRFQRWFPVEDENVKEKEQQPNESGFPRTKREQTGQPGGQITAPTKKLSRYLARPQVKEPAGAGEEKRETIGPPRNVIDGGAVDGMNEPEKRDQEGGQGKRRGIRFSASETRRG